MKKSPWKNEGKSGKKWKDLKKMKKSPWKNEKKREKLEKSTFGIFIFFKFINENRSYF